MENYPSNSILNKGYTNSYYQHSYYQRGMMRDRKTMTRDKKLEQAPGKGKFET